jgi:hypothetical protein
VECHAEEHLCGKVGGGGDDGGQEEPLHCSVAGVCGMTALPEGMESFLSSTGASIDDDPGELRVSLAGKARVVLEVGTPFPECSPDAPPGWRCDRGAVADSAEDGRISSNHATVGPPFLLHSLWRLSLDTCCS